MKNPQRPNPRQEKNRHHLATLLSALLAVALLSASHILLPGARPIVHLTAVAATLMYATRTLIIELGVRRQGISAEINFERRSRIWLRRHFGIVFVEDVIRLDSESA